jgi:hypothetical protein
MTTDDLEGRDDSMPRSGFSARDVFDPDSEYNARRSCYKPELKLRGLFYEIKARKEAAGVEREAMAAKPPPVSLAVFADEPERPLDARLEFHIFPVPSQDETMRLNLWLEDERDHLPSGTPCRAFLLTEGLIARLCGPPALKSPDWTRAALHDVFRGALRLPGDAVNRTLAAVPEVEGRFEEKGTVLGKGRFKFDHFTLPRLAGGAKPDDVRAIVVVIDRRIEETEA